MAVETWNRLPPPGFAGLRSDVPVTFYYRHLPHWRQDGATYFVTFRLQSRKRRMTQQVNSKLGAAGTLWQEESFDRIVRDVQHLHRCIRYIGDNPRRAGLKQDDRPRWIRPAWVKLGWGFEE